MNTEEQDYLKLLSKIMTNGASRADRTGTGTLSIFGDQLRFNLRNGFPLLTTKRMFARGIFEELMFFIRGKTQTKELEAKGVNIWKGNTSREYLDSRGLNDLADGDMGKGYGYQWRNFGGTDGKPGVDQLAIALDKIKNDPFSRKIVVSAWNPEQLSEMALEPCHCMFQFYVNDGELSCHWYQRSVDSFLGLPYNIASYALLTAMMAKAAGLKVGDLIFSGGDIHIYSNHLEQVSEQISREPFGFPRVEIKKSLSSIEDIESLGWSDVVISGYESHGPLAGKMAI
jgi:thymidylate synthase